MKRKGWVFAAVVLPGVTVAWAQEIEPVKPTPSATSPRPPKPPREPPSKPPASAPAPSAEPPASSSVPIPEAPPAPSPKQQCENDGGEWRGGGCDTSKNDCEAEGKRWDAEHRTCHAPGPAPCPDGTRRDGDACEPISPSPQPQDCEAGDRWENGVCVQAGTHQHPFPPDTDDGGAFSLRSASIIGGGVLLGAGAVFGALAFVKKDSWSSACDGKLCYESAQDDYDQGKRYAAYSTGAFATGAILMTAGLFIIPDASPKEDANRPEVGMAVGPGGGFLSAQWLY